MTDQTYFPLPDNLPVPEDDGAARHLTGMGVPPVSLPSTAGRDVNLAALGSGRVVLYLYPMTGTPGVPLLSGWDDIPGARGCTPESYGFRNLYPEFQALEVGVLGGSTQTLEEQKEAKRRLALPFDLVADDNLSLARALALPTFEVEGRVMLKRLTLVLKDGRIEHVFYPIFPPDKHAGEVIDWLRTHPAAG